MNEKFGAVFSMVEENPPVAGCTVSREIHSGRNGVICFSLAKKTDISAEIYPYHKMFLVADGEIDVYGPAIEVKKLRIGDGMVAPTETPVGVSSVEGAVYTEISIRKDDVMNETVKTGEVFRLADLVPYQEKKIVNMDIAHNNEMKFVVMAFDEGTGLSPHAAPGEAIVFALDGEAVIGYEGKEHSIKTGENFCFAKGGMHWIRAEKRFKMALLLTLE